MVNCENERKSFLRWCDGMDGSLTKTGKGEYSFQSFSWKEGCFLTLLFGMDEDGIPCVSRKVSGRFGCPVTVSVILEEAGDCKRILEETKAMFGLREASLK